jgi:hypothetical protein
MSTYINYLSLKLTVKVHISVLTYLPIRFDFVPELMIFSNYYSESLPMFALFTT